MAELYDEFFYMLRFLKNICNCGMEEQLKDWFGFHELDSDNYWELAYAAIGWVFRNTHHYYNENQEIETWLFMDPIIDRFCQLCQEYEVRRGISEETNPFRQNIERIIREEFHFNSFSYYYDWRLSPKDRGRRCLLLLTGCEFYCQESIPESLLEIRDAFLMLSQKLEAELTKETRIIPLSLVTAAQWKEEA